MKHILIVDEDQEHSDKLSEALRSEECDVIAVHTGKEAIDTLEKKGIHMLICDLKFPPFHGFHIVEWIKANPDFKYIIVLMLIPAKLRLKAGKAHPATREHFFQKPLDLLAFVEKAHELVKTAIS